MKHLTAALALSLLATSSIHAATPAKSSGHAVTLCKEQASVAHEGYKRADTTRIKLTRGVYKIKMRVLTESGTEITSCKINKEGEISYTKA